MRTYIFTDFERKILQTWLKEGDRNPSLNKLLSRIDLYHQNLILDLKLLNKAIKRYNAGY